MEAKNASRFLKTLGLPFSTRPIVHVHCFELQVKIHSVQYTICGIQNTVYIHSIHCMVQSGPPIMYSVKFTVLSTANT